MSASGPKQTCRKTQSVSLLGVKQTWLVAAHMSACDPKRTSRWCDPSPVQIVGKVIYGAVSCRAKPSCSDSKSLQHWRRRAESLPGRRESPFAAHKCAEMTIDHAKFRS